MDWRRFPGLVSRRNLKAPELSPLPDLPLQQGSGEERAQLQASEWKINPELFRTRIRRSTCLSYAPICSDLKT